MISLILRTATRFLMPVLLLFFALSPVAGSQ